MSHFVYLYRDQNGKAVYVGYGENSARALSHMSRTHNIALEALLKNDNLKLEIAGPFNNSDTALAVETALISALKPDANVAPGHERHRFRPIGVPLEFANRFDQPPLSHEDLLSIAQAHNAPQFLCVLINDKNFIDESGDIRPGYDPANPPDENLILERAVRWWQLRPKLEIWTENPAQSPAILLAIHGKPGAQFIIASVFTDRENWNDTNHDGAYYEVPTSDTPKLDAANLRGRRISPDAGLRFNLNGLILFP